MRRLLPTSDPSTAGRYVRNLLLQTNNSDRRTRSRAGSEALLKRLKIIIRVYRLNLILKSAKDKMSDRMNIGHPYIFDLASVKL